LSRCLRKSRLQLRAPVAPKGARRNFSFHLNPNLVTTANDLDYTHLISDMYIGMFMRIAANSGAYLTVEVRGRIRTGLFGSGEEVDRKMRTNVVFRCRRCARITALALVGLGTAAAHATVTYTDLYTLSTPAGFSNAFPYRDQTAPGGQIAGYGFNTMGQSTHALLWSGPAGGTTDLNPSQFTTSYAVSVGGTQQVGYGAHLGSSSYHALLWNGSASSAVDLNPSGFINSQALGTNGTQQVGYGQATAAGNNNHALVWTGSSGTAVDLNPTGFTASYAIGTCGTEQVGAGYSAVTGNNYHALLWNGSTGSAIDLNTSGFPESYALATNGTQQVGYGYDPQTGIAHALLWTGSAASTIDLNPSGFTKSYVYGLSGTTQVGYGQTTNGTTDALFWSGTANSFIDLQSVLPHTLQFSEAFSISGDTVYGTAEDPNGKYHAIAWTISLPEPARLPLIVLAGLGLFRWRKREFNALAQDGSPS
jgi:hypothetical protein